MERLDNGRQRIVDATILDFRDETLIASADTDMFATITSNRNLVLIARQFVWMELFTQRISAYQLVVGMLCFAVVDQEPPAHLRERILSPFNRR